MLAKHSWAVWYWQSQYMSSPNLITHHGAFPAEAQLTGALKDIPAAKAKAAIIILVMALTTEVPPWHWPDPLKK
jgi:hypothetical protein